MNGREYVDVLLPGGVMIVVDADATLAVAPKINGVGSLSDCETTHDVVAAIAAIIRRPGAPLVSSSGEALRINAYAALRYASDDRPSKPDASE